MRLVPLRLAVMLLGLCGGVAVGLPSAHPILAVPPRVLARPTSGGHVTVIILDMSGSMAQNDPLGVRCSAANAYIDLSGPGDVVGVIDLDGRAADPTHAQLLAAPTEMATAQARAALQQSIAAQTNHCAPDNETPTQDALAKAVAMLDQATNGGAIPGSAILLTDGAPDPNGPQQIAAITTTLVPQFQHHGWPIDVVALGVNQTADDHTYHQFLAGLSNATGGNYYDDGQGVVSGVSPLNIADFFVNIFARNHGRVLGPTVAPTALNGGTAARDFALGAYDSHLDVIAVKDHAATAVTLQTPAGQAVVADGPGITVLRHDPYYTIYSIDGPAAGTWQLRASGSGQFLMDSLAQTTLAVSPPVVTASGSSSRDKRDAPATSLPLGEPLSVQVSLSANGAVQSGAGFMVGGIIQYVGGAAATGGVPAKHGFPLTETPPGSGAFVGTVTVDAAAPPGSYAISVNVTQISSVPLTSTTITVSLIRFPRPVFLRNGAVVTGTARTTLVAYDPVLSWFYSVPILDIFGGLALRGQPAQPVATFAAQVQRNGQPYCAAQLTASAARSGQSGSVPLTVQRGAGCGNFTVAFPAGAQGTYAVTFVAHGSAADTFGIPSRTTLVAQVVVQGAGGLSEALAYVFALLYLLLLALIINAVARPWPAGNFKVESGDPPAKFPRSGDFGSRRWSGLTWRQRQWSHDTVNSQQMGLPEGLVLRFKRIGGHRVAIALAGKAGANWKLTHGDSANGDGVTLEYRVQAANPPPAADSAPPPATVYRFRSAGKLSPKKPAGTSRYGAKGR